MSDWFAFGLEGKAWSGLDRVLIQEESKLQFVRALKLALAPPLPHAPDRITLIHDDIKTLDKTLRLRVATLSPDRPAAWFSPTAPYPADEYPKASAELHDPVFMPFAPDQAALIRLVIPEFWRHKTAANDRYDPGYSLWGRLLTLNKKLTQLNQLDAPFQDINLDELPEAIPDELSSPSLLVFGARIAQRMRVCRRDLEACYAFLWPRSESFLLQALPGNHRAQRSHGQQETSFPPPWMGQTSGPLEEALQFMNFPRLPNFTDLRQRYWAMAQRLHPDRGGCDERFKLLSLHYQALLKQLEFF